MLLAERQVQSRCSTNRLPSCDVVDHCPLSMVAITVSMRAAETTHRRCSRLGLLFLCRGREGGSLDPHLRF